MTAMRCHRALVAGRAPWSGFACNRGWVSAGERGGYGRFRHARARTWEARHRWPSPASERPRSLEGTVAGPVNTAPSSAAAGADGRTQGAAPWRPRQARRRRPRPLFRKARHLTGGVPRPTRSRRLSARREPKNQGEGEAVETVAGRKRVRNARRLRRAGCSRARGSAPRSPSVPPSSRPPTRLAAVGRAARPPCLRPHPLRAQRGTASPTTPRPSPRPPRQTHPPWPAHRPAR